MITAQGIHKFYKSGGGRLQILKGIDLKIDAGYFAAIVGPSGAGKSTLLHILGGLDRPDSGSVKIEDADIYGAGQSRLSALRNEKIGFVFQFYHLLPEFTALENVLLPALVSRKSSLNFVRDRSAAPQLRSGQVSRQSKYKLSPIGYRLSAKQRAGELLEIVGLTGRMSHRPSELSGGEQQRVAIARALVNSPKMLFCDEPTGNLDSKAAGAIMELLLKLNTDEGLTCVMVTHEEGLVRDAQAVFHMQDGRLL